MLVFVPRETEASAVSRGTARVDERFPKIELSIIITVSLRLKYPLKT
jgi:hypothetical protein